MRRRGFLAGLLALPFAKPALGAALNAIERMGLPAVATRGRTYLDLAAATACLKELYDGQRVHDLVYKENPLLMYLHSPEKYREYMKPANVCRRRIEDRRKYPVLSHYADWHDATLLNGWRRGA